MRAQILTPYQATKIFNAHREQCGLTPVNSPMMYIQMNKGKFPAVRNADGRWQIIDIEAFVAWVVQHNGRQLAKKLSAEATETETVKVREILAIEAGSAE